MIRSFRSKTLERFAATGNPKGLSVQKPERIARLLKALASARSPMSLDLPGLRFHKLKGKDRNRFAVWVSENRRMTFAWSGDDAIDVDLEDYH
jgi:proteic killer suppression protein